MTEANSSISLVGPTPNEGSKWKDPAIRGALWKVTACLSFSGINGIVHYFAAMDAPISVPQIAFFESVFGLLLILPWLFSVGENPFKTKQYPRYIFRAFAAALGLILWFSALKVMPIVNVMAFKYTSPFFTLVGAKLFLGERIGAARATAIAVALSGAVTITILGKGDFFDVDWKELSLLILMPLGSTACFATSAVLGKKLSKVDSPQIICFFLLLFTIPILLAATFLPYFGWVNPESWQWPWLVAMGACLALAYYALGNAYVAADLSYLLPLSFTRLVAGALIGMFFFAEWPNIWTWIGSFLILLASVTLCQHEVKRKLKKQRMKEKNIAVAQTKEQPVPGL